MNFHTTKERERERERGNACLSNLFNLPNVVIVPIPIGQFIYDPYGKQFFSFLLFLKERGTHNRHIQ